MNRISIALSVAAASLLVAPITQAESGSIPTSKQMTHLAGYHDSRVALRYPALRGHCVVHVSGRQTSNYISGSFLFESLCVTSNNRTCSTHFNDHQCTGTSMKAVWYCNTWVDAYRICD